MTWSYYVYYRVDAAQTTACAQAAAAVMQAVHAKTGLRGRLLKKRNEPLLWMEIYEGVSDEAAFEWELAEAVAQAGLLRFLQPGGGRHTECFAE